MSHSWNWNWISMNKKLLLRSIILYGKTLQEFCKSQNRHAFCFLCYFLSFLVEIYDRNIHATFQFLAVCQNRKHALKAWFLTIFNMTIVRKDKGPRKTLCSVKNCGHRDEKVFRYPSDPGQCFISTQKGGAKSVKLNKNI